MIVSRNVALVLIGLLGLGAGRATAVEILLPKPDTAVDSARVVLIGSGARDSRVGWRVEGSGGVETGTAKVLSGGQFSASLALYPGLNQVRVGSRSLQVFSTAGGGRAPEGFTPSRDHAGDITNCKDCHQAELAVRGGGYPEVCLYCHVVEAQNREFAGVATEDRHFLAASSNCGKCHDPHGTADPKLLLGASEELCGNCHGQWDAGAEVHPAYDEGGCVACHDPHFSGYPKQLTGTVSQVCGECHEQGADGNHEPVNDAVGCGNCHDVHGRNGTMTPVSAPSLCVGCHDGVMGAGHGEQLEDCLDCHDPHGDGGMVLASVAESCGDCHDSVGEGQTVHAALEEGCDSCHSPHADDNLARARVGCGDCHDTSEDRELASLHGGMDLPVGSCSACHPAHAANSAGLLLGPLHFPLTQGKCTACHAAGTQDFTVVDAARCRMCHPFERQFAAEGKAVHDPVSAGECSICHQPHLANRRALLRGEQADICGECHDVAVERAEQMLHTAVESCTDCHGPHGGGEFFLTAAVESLCMECHDDPADGPGEVHPALDEGCVSCHSPHRGYSPGVLTMPQRVLCLECHDDPGGSAPHRAGGEGQICTNCHAPHRSENSFLLRAADSSSGEGVGQRDTTVRGTVSPTQ